ncbi:hypothetical protein NC652_005624 [Populus alba x Populus x berolinensis]|nr:hypothetical protein NC652_005624 [Populus alba x Populus x berolinensis]
MNIESNCSPLDLLIVNIALACIDGALACIAFSQAIYRPDILTKTNEGIRSELGFIQNGTLTRRDVYIRFISIISLSMFTRIHLRNQQTGWTRQKVTSSTLYLQLLLLVIGGLAGLMHVVLSSWANEEDEDEEENSSQQPLLESSKNKPGSMNTDSFWSCCSFRGIHVGGRQKFVITVVVLIFFLMLSFAVIIWIGVGKNPIRSSVAARVYVDFFASAILILGGALGCYGLLLFLKLRNVRSETASSEMRKVAGLAVVSVVCFTSSAAVALLTDVPVRRCPQPSYYGP